MTDDDEVEGKKVQIKGTQGNNQIDLREEPEFLLVEYLDKESGMTREIYNGPRTIAWPAASYVPNMNHYAMRINRLLELDKIVPDEQRIRALIPIEKYVKPVFHSECTNTAEKRSQIRNRV